MGFYEEIVSDYDSMTRFQERRQREISVLQQWIERYHFRSALDTACGTGLHAVILAQLGLDVVAADISEAMLQQARSHARELNVSIPWVQSGMQDLSQKFDRHFDAVLCLGNSLPHLVTQADLQAAIESFWRLLAPGGILVIQMLNYDRVLELQERLVGIHREGTTEYIRFYDFLPECLRFNLLTVEWEADKASRHRLSSTELYPYRKRDLEAALKKFEGMTAEYYGSMDFHPFAERESPNLVLAARKASRS
ncbi:hypothetical protein CSB45_14435 [candidate division KSB3 bacterium]|uniref:Methyltransferase domain-containing protein n=1 Tax=candidate division KSB3 bacterium TaxID=2044937 RepID=A0A2G6E1G7_9BACT|nr:MAG: hypothetical protein CSB45_14435 [candidate division KSB3 bacterium]PIE30352.1 MAG: hypothetical protein CSA57_03435 [candidate division KSB3 bacterium]